MINDESDLPELPKGWVWTTLREIAEINPKFLYEHCTDDMEVTFLPMKCVEELTGNLNLSLTRRLSEVKKGYTPFIDDDILFAKITPCMENGKVAIAHGLKNGIGFGSTEFHVLRLPESLPRKFLFFFLIREELRKDAKRNMTGTAGQLRVPPGYMEQLSIPIPPLPEQYRIVAKIEELFTKLDAGVSSLEKVKAQLKRYRQAVLKYAFEGKLTEEWREAHKSELEPASSLLERIKEERQKNAKGKLKELPPVDTSDLPELPEGWVWTRLGEIVVDVEKVNPKDNPDGEFVYLDIASIDNTQQIITNPKKYLGKDAPSRARQLVKGGDILFSTVRTYLKNIAMVNEVYDGQIASTGFCVIRPHISVHKKLIFYLTQMNFFLNPLTQIQRGTSYPAVRDSDVFNQVFPFPPLPEQHRIVEEIERRLSVADEVEKIVEQNLKQSERLRQSILKKAFEGKLVPQDPTDEPASVHLERIKKERAAEKKSKTKKSKRYEQRRLI